MSRKRVWKDRFDVVLRDKLAKLQTQMFQTQHSLRGIDGKKCACGGQRLCAFHSHIYYNLDKAIEQLGYAIDAIDSLDD